MSMKQTRKTPAARKRAVTPSNSSNAADSVGRNKTLSHEERQRMVAEAAYYRAMQRGFVAGGEIDDWLAAEREIDRQLARSRDPLPARNSGMGRKRQNLDVKAAQSQ